MPAPTYDYFGTNPVTIVLQTSSAFDGVALLPGVIGDIKPGLITFPVQAGGGLIDFHTRPLLIQNIMAKAGLVVDVSMIYAGGVEVVVGKIEATNKSISESFVLPVNAALKLSSIAAGEVSIVAMEYIPGNTL